MLVKDIEDARALAGKYLAVLPVSQPIELAVRDERTMETEFWLDLFLELEEVSGDWGVSTYDTRKCPLDR